jgi:hypothetical protein
MIQTQSGRLLRFLLIFAVVLGLFTACLAIASQALYPSPQAGLSQTPSPSQEATREIASEETLAEASPTGVPPSPGPTSPPTTTPLSPTQTPIPEPKVRFAIIGDYGLAGQPLADVAALVKSWNPDLILTTGDNNYPLGEAATIDQNIGQYFHEYIAPYPGAYGPGGEVNRFFPVLGNHDYYSEQGKPYLDYFTLPGNERYYDFIAGPAHFFALNGDYNEPDGVGASSAQAKWLQTGLSASISPWKIVYTHPAPYSSGLHGSSDWMRWPFAAWGASTVLAGHDHLYERLEIDGIPYFVNGIGGGPIYSFKEAIPGSQARYNADYGAMLGEATPERLTFTFITRKGEVVDTLTLEKSEK